ncbi:cathepsin O-like isoform X2 [Prorops nasuta]|uniref:cathepsin O-like isoform X2 n=1 Tax=Prorops nasuta TaxID=863751 RepID=UPI0034CFD7D9
MEWKTLGKAFLIISLSLLVIPIRIGRNSKSGAGEIKLFESYVARYNKTYRHNPEEYGRRFERFQKSLREIERLNSLRTSEESAYYGLTEYSDLAEDEFLQKTLRPDISERGARHKSSPHHREHRKPEVANRLKRAVAASAIPTKVDWRAKGVISPVRSQGSCGACWAFSTVEVIESMFAIQNGSLRLFSIQEMIDCARNSNFGCNGGDICSLLTWLVATKVTVFPEVNYPLTRKTESCKLQDIATNRSGIRVSDFTCDSFLDAEDELLTTLAQHGPVAAAVNALPWQNYLGGIIQYHCDGSFANLNHAVQIIGYDQSASIPYYIVKNSWSTLFGDKGYAYIAIGKNMCGIAHQVSSLDVLL